MNGFSILDHQSIPPGFFGVSSSPAPKANTGLWPGWENDSGAPGLHRAPTKYLGGLGLPYQDLTRLVMQGQSITLTPTPAEETRVSGQLSRANDVLRRLPDSKKQAQQRE